MKRQFKLKNPVEHKIRQMSENLIKRLTTSIDKPENRSYKEKGIKSLIGNNSSEVYKYIYENFYEDIKYLIDNDEVPSIDRIDSDKHYEDGNIRIISFSENSKLGRINSKKVCSKKVKIIHKKDGKEEVYSSVVEAGEKSGFTRFILHNIHKNKVKKDHGIIVEYLEEEVI